MERKLKVTKIASDIILAVAIMTTTATILLFDICVLNTDFELVACSIMTWIAYFICRHIYGLVAAAAEKEREWRERDRERSLARKRALVENSTHALENERGIA